MSLWREQRRAELVALRNSDPAKLLAKYRSLIGLDAYSQLPYGVSFASMD
jgi:hypothetical protein